MIEFQPEELLTYLSQPTFFSALAAAYGLNWSVSSHTQLLMTMLKKDVSKQGIAVFTRNVPNQFHLPWVLTAKMTTCALQEGHGQLMGRYLFFSKKKWVIIHQKTFINHDTRRYHWTEQGLQGVMGSLQTSSFNLLAREAEQARKAILDLAQEPVQRLNSQLAEIKAGQRSLHSSPKNLPHPLPKRFFPDYLCTVREKKPSTFEDLLLLRGIGPATIRGLAAIASVFYNAHPSFEDPLTHTWHGISQKQDAKDIAHYAKILLEKAASLSKRERCDIEERLQPLVGKSL